MGHHGTNWHDNGDGTFTALDGYYGGGHSWLDLYLMRSADASEVPDTSILRNWHEAGENKWTGDKEVTSALAETLNLSLKASRRARQGDRVALLASLGW